MNDSDPSKNGRLIGQFAMIPLWVERRLRGESVALHVYVRLVVKYADREGHAHPKREMLAADLGYSVKTVERALQVLRDRGVLQTTKRRDLSGYICGNDYELITVEADSPIPNGGLSDTTVAQDSKATSESLRTSQSDTTVAQDHPKGHQSRLGVPPKRHLSPSLSDTRVAAEKITRSSTTTYVRTTPLTPLAGGLHITKRDLRDAERIRNTLGGCRHDPRCPNHDECITRIAWMRRREQVTTAEQLAAEETKLAGAARS